MKGSELGVGGIGGNKQEVKMTENYTLEEGETAERRIEPWRGFAVVETADGFTNRKRLPRRILEKLVASQLPYLDVRRYLYPGDKFKYIEFDYF